MIYLRKYDNAEEMENGYYDNKDTRFIVVSGYTFYFAYEVNGEYRWGNDYRGAPSFNYANVAVTETRNPQVGDDVTFSINYEGWIDSTVEAVDEPKKGTDYHEPWVSLVPNTLVHKFLLSCNCDHGEWVYGAKFFGEIGGAYAWSAFNYRGGDWGAPEIGMYYTTVRNPEYETPVYASLNGLANDYPIGCVESILETTNQVMYNKESNWIKVGYWGGSSGDYVQIMDYDDAFDDSENSTYYLIDGSTLETTVSKGVKPYWNTYHDLFIGEIPCYTYYYLDKQGDDWVIESGYMPCEGHK